LFAKKLYFKSAKYLLTWEIGQNNSGREWPKGEDG
jgi:hypothetical protein